MADGYTSCIAVLALLVLAGALGFVGVLLARTNRALIDVARKGPFLIIETYRGETVRQVYRVDGAKTEIQHPEGGDFSAFQPDPGPHDPDLYAQDNEPDVIGERGL